MARQPHRDDRHGPRGAAGRVKEDDPMTDHKMPEHDAPKAAPTAGTAAEPTPEIVEYPKMLYDPDGAQRIVASKEEQQQLGGDWSETPRAATDAKGAPHTP